MLRYIVEKRMVDRVRNVEIGDKLKLTVEDGKESSELEKIFGRDGFREISKESACG